MEKNFRKRDRTARLLKIEILLSQNPPGLSVTEIAKRCDVSKRTAYRDLEALESELGVPIWEDAYKRGISEGYFLPSITFTQNEAVSLFLAARMTRYYSSCYNSNVISPIMKLATVFPPFLKTRLQKTIEHMQYLPMDHAKIRIFNNLIQAWLFRHPVIIQYQNLINKKPVECTVEPYSIEPAIRNYHACLIGYSHLEKKVITFKIDHIVGKVIIKPETYEIPDDFDIDEFLRYSWGTRADTKVDIVKLHFSKRTSQEIIDTYHHPTQVIQVQPDGSLLITFKIKITDAFMSWILSFGKDVEVIKPKSARNRMINHLRVMTDYYGLNKLDKGSIVNGDLNLDFLISNNFDISDDQWKQIAPLLPPQSRIGRPRVDDRHIVNGIIKRLRYGVKWKDIPREYGAMSTCFTRYKLWQQKGVWGRIWKMLNTNESYSDYHFPKTH